MLTLAPRTDSEEFGGGDAQGQSGLACAALGGRQQAGSAQLGVDSFAGYFFSKLTNVADGTAPLDVQYS